ncbi:N-acetylmuramoyl-L-alanine amidase C-terminal domain-containing protein [Bacillus sp. NH11B]|uniref:N-acetylmuramoyl-L-alanine amidase C-terminal domain-containing protein n=1 Tax=Bacillus sp. NH11B TaxID=1866314 RepID=UPI0008FE67CB|nr:N-acetylmuramoyl-L-alanine amidase C-terminal domain-containing protein [Bacillus sp. NH11B]OJD58593.1 N-acetylmuramoyl-L-alanine amidase [Bacillus sp. NH11B]
MGCFAGSGGHNNIVQGANSVYGKEHVEDRKFLDAVAKYVQAAGWKYVNCSDEVGTTQTTVWSNAANNHLRVADSNADLQFHLNASPGGTGCEVWLHPSYGNRELAAKISKAMADAFGLRDRGIKFSTDLGWINKTKTGLLPEICFIDNEVDMKKYRDNFDKAAKAVAEVIVGKTIQSGGGSNVSNGGYQYVKSGGFGTNLLNEAIQAMAERGVKGNVVVDPLTGLCYIQTEVLPNPELDKITWWMDTRPGGKWFYEYIKVK